jgi:hypothetical protein
MPKLSLKGLKDPRRRPRFIIWTGAMVMFLAAFTIAALGITSTYWFCAEVCHKVQDDTIIAYDNSSHSNIHCMSCHMPVNADPATFMLHKVTALGELYLTVTDNFELPLNNGSHLSQDAQHMGSEQCTQCHGENREITPSEGIIIDHAIHAEEDVHCTLCHNRVAHPEDFELTLPGNTKHPDFMEMTACFRCHGLEEGAAAPGECGACHPADFELKPASHRESGFFPAGHAELAREDIERVAAAAGGGHGEGEGEPGAGEGESEETTGGEDQETDAGSLFGVSPAYASEGGDGWELVSVDEVSYCGTCHLEEFCTNCHGMEIPHPDDFKETTHPEVAKAQLDRCEFCHVQSETFFCDECHHDGFDAATPWENGHAVQVQSAGITGCLETCHETQYCSDCHAEKSPFPTSHKEGDWLRRASFEERARHSETAKAEISGCEICHGQGGVESKFCTDCHKIEMPHADEFTEFHAKTGRDNPAVCANCHTFKELCSDCHHEGSSPTKPWTQVHPQTVQSMGTAGCFEKCHQKEYCVDCHTTTEVVPSSHNAGDWLKPTQADTRGRHTTSFTEAADSCVYCHGDGGAQAAFCMNCHKVDMPHPDEYPDSHGPAFAANELRKNMCTTCHKALFCDQCHHESYTGAQPWQKEHPAVVKENGADPCFECHEPTFCAACHVKLGQGS